MLHLFALSSPHIYRWDMHYHDGHRYLQSVLCVFVSRCLFLKVVALNVVSAVDLRRRLEHSSLIDCATQKWGGIQGSNEEND